MHIVCDRIGLPKEKRQTLLGKKYGRSPTTGRNWLTGEKIPDYETAIQMCTDAKVNYEWLMRGAGIMQSTDDTESLVISDPILIDLVNKASSLNDEQRQLAVVEVEKVVKLAAQIQAQYEAKK